MMTFSITSLWFFVFLAAALLLYYLLPGKLQWGWLLVASFGFIFLSVGLSPFLFLAVDILAVYGGTLLIEKTENPVARRWELFAVLLIVIGQLFMLKYYDGIAPWLSAAIARVFGFSAFTWRSTFLAPIGISYFSLSAIGYILDVYWGTCRAQRNPFKLSLWISWFPALVSGPIVRYAEQSVQLFTEHRFCYRSVKFGFERILWGLFLKMVIADRLSIFTTAILGADGVYTGFYMVVALLLFAFQLYADFSGCMDIVLGVSEMFQIGLPENFQRPFFARNLSEFWRRWHITLGEWSKDYLLYPILKSAPFINLGSVCRRRFGKKKGKNVPTYIGLFILWLMIGIWHGGTAKYIFAAGILPWILLVGGQLLQPVFTAMTRWLKVNTACLSYRIFSSLRTLFLMCVIWLFASSASLLQGFKTLTGLFPPFNVWVLFNDSLFTFGLDIKDFVIVFIGLTGLFAVSLLQEQGKHIRAALDRQNLVFQWLILLGGIMAVILLGIYGPGYNPANFIYGGF